MHASQPATALVFAGGDAVPADVAERLPGDAFVVAADSGLEHAQALGRHVDLVVGDFDSADPDAVAAAESAGSEIERHPVAKDQTDLELALAAAARSGATRIVVVGGYGGRLDHFLANALVLAGTATDGVAVEWATGEALVTVIRPRRRAHGEPRRPVLAAGRRWSRPRRADQGVALPARRRRPPAGIDPRRQQRVHRTRRATCRSRPARCSPSNHGRDDDAQDPAVRRVVLVCGATGCDSDGSGDDKTLRLVTHDSFAVSDDVLAEFTEQTGFEVKVVAGGRRGRGAQPGDPHQGRSPRRRVLRRRQHLPDAARPRPASSCRTSHPSSPTSRRSTSSTRSTGSRPVDHGDVCINFDKAYFASSGLAVPRVARRPDAAGVRGPARDREPGDVVARTGVPAGLHRPVRRGRLARLLGAATGQRRGGRRGLGAGVQRRVHRGRGTGRQAPRGLVRVEPAGGGVLLRPAAGRVADRHRAGELLQPDRVRRDPEGHRQGAGGPQARRLHALDPVPGGHPAEHVRLPRARRRDPAGRVRASSPTYRPSRSTCPRTRSARTATDGSRNGPTPCSADPETALLGGAGGVRGGVLRVPGRHDHRQGAVARRVARPRPARRRRHRRRPPRGPLVHALAGGAVDGADCASSRCPAHTCSPATTFPAAGFCGRRSPCRSCSPPWSWARRSAASSRRTARSARSDGSSPWRPSCSPTSSSTTRWSCARSVGCGRTSIPARRKRRGSSALAAGSAFLAVTLPALRPAIAAAASIVFLFTFTSFGVILILGGPRYATLEVEIYRQTVEFLNLPVAAALTIVQLLAVVALLAVLGPRPRPSRPRPCGCGPRPRPRRRPARGAARPARRQPPRHGRAARRAAGGAGRALVLRRPAVTGSRRTGRSTSSTGERRCSSRRSRPSATRWCSPRSRPSSPS